MPSGTPVFVRARTIAAPMTPAWSRPPGPARPLHPGRPPPSSRVPRCSEKTCLYTVRLTTAVQPRRAQDATARRRLQPLVRHLTSDRPIGQWL